MFRSLLFILLAIWILRLLQGRRPAGKRPPASEFHPGAGAGDPPSAADTGDHPAFSSGEIVDGEFEDISGPERP